jgi:hypothetical protein
MTDTVPTTGPTALGGARHAIDRAQRALVLYKALDNGHEDGRTAIAAIDVAIADLQRLRDALQAEIEAKIESI